MRVRSYHAAKRTSAWASPAMRRAIAASGIATNATSPIYGAIATAHAITTTSTTRATIV
jgi:hypothetical protein